MADKVLTAPLAIIKVRGVPIGRMKNIRIVESFRRGRVIGLGDLTPQEVPALEWTGTLSCGFFMVDFNRRSAIPNALLREVNTLGEFIDTVLLTDSGVDVDLLKKVAAGPPDPSTGIIPSNYQTIGSVKGLFLDRDSLDISDGNIAGRDQEFTYLYPLLYQP